MSKYKGKTISLDKSAEEVAHRFADLTRLQSLADQLPEEQKKQIGNAVFERDSITLQTPQLGQVKFCITERTPSCIVMKAEGTPVPLGVNVDLHPVSPQTTEATCSIDVDIPMMLRPMVAPHLQKAADMLTDIIARVIN